MTKHILFALAAAAGLAACSGNPMGGSDDGGGGGGGGGDTTALIPETVSMNVEESGLAGWSAGDASFSITMSAADAADLSATYSRNAALDIAGYQAYTYQSTASNRMVVALVSKAGGAGAVTAVEAGQFSNYHGGAQVWRADVFTAPETGVGEAYNYSASYVGLLNVGSDTPGGPGGTLNPTQAYRTTGTALVTADFTEMRVSGGVNGRTIQETGTVLPDIAMEETGITADGTFTDKLNRVGSSGWTQAGSYAGVFGGTNAADVAVVMVFNPNDTPNLWEHGMIVSSNCATAGGTACP